MKKVCIAALFCFFFLSSSFAQSKQETVKVLFHLMQTDSIMEKTFSSIVPGIMSQMPGIPTDSASKAQMSEKMNSMMQIANKICKKLMDEEMVEIYAKYFTQDEINGLITFYKTSVGQKFIKSTPAIQGELMTVMMQKYIPEMQSAIKESIEKNK